MSEKNIERATGRKPSDILQVVCDQNMLRHVQFAGDDSPVWLTMTEIAEFGAEVVGKLQRHSIIAITTQSKNAIKRAAEEASVSGHALVASHPGWLTESIYVTGDGEVLSAQEREGEVIVAFEPDRRFAATGTLADWREGLGPVVEDNATASFLLAYALSALLLRFAPSEMHNPYVELVGPAESGKTSFALLACSVFAGGDGQLGGAQSWNATAGALEQMRERYADSLQVLDEQNEQDALLKADSTQLFKQASGSHRRRYKELDQGAEIRHATLSTSNDVMSGMGKPGTAVAQAAATRRLAIVFSEQILAEAPEGYATTAEAVSKMRREISTNYGVAAREFVRRILNATTDDLAGWREQIASAISEFETSAFAEQLDSARIRKVFGLVWIAGRLADAWDVLPLKTMPIDKAIEELVPRILRADPSTAATTSERTADEALADLVEQVRQKTQRVQHGGDTQVLQIPHPSLFRDGVLVYDAAEVVDRNGQTTLYVRPDVVRRILGPNHRHILQELRAKGRLRTEVGLQPKLQIKTPRGVSLGSRSYAFVLSD